MKTLKNLEILIQIFEVKLNIELKKIYRADIEQILGVTKSRKALGLGISNIIEPIRIVNTGVTRQVENLVNNDQPFTNNQA